MAKRHLPSWLDPKVGLCRVQSIQWDEPLPDACPVCGADPADWYDQGERLNLDPEYRCEVYLCGTCGFMVVERLIPDVVNK